MGSKGTRAENERRALDPTTYTLPGLVETHAHLDDPRLFDRLGQVLTQARQAGVEQIVTIGTTRSDSEVACRLAEEYSGIFAAVAIQPNHVHEAEPGDFAVIAELARRERVVAVGETGLDCYWDRAPLDLQAQYFDRHLELAETLDRPVVIHCRESEQEILAQLHRWNRPIRGVLHSFTGGVEDARGFLDCGLHISLAGQVTFRNKSLESLREAARFVPEDRLMVETDSPYLSPEPLRGRTNEPCRVALTARCLAELRQIAPERLAEITSRNARELFDLPVDQVLSGCHDA